MRIENSGIPYTYNMYVNLGTHCGYVFVCV